MRRPSPTRRGVALLLVLATLVLAVTAAAGLARVATGARLHAHAAQRERTADALLDAADTPVLDWLHRHAGRVVLPPDATSPRYTVLDDAMEIGGEACRLTITAFDECGMAPPGWDGAVLPADVTERIERAGEAISLHPGLDLLGSVGANAGGRPDYSSLEGASLPAIGELVATHNPVLPGRQPAVNVNTAPLPLLEAVYAARRLGGLEAVVEARTAGRVSSPGAIRVPRVEGAVPLPVAMSMSWVFRIDCRVGTLRRAWWCVYADTGSNWERVQRLAITE